jgi:predicted amidohydrolase
MKKFDLLIKDGNLVDAANRRDGRFDIGLATGRVVRVEPEINPDQAQEIFSAQLFAQPRPQSGSFRCPDPD